MTFTKADHVNWAADLVAAALVPGPDIVEFEQKVLELDELALNDGDIWDVLYLLTFLAARAVTWSAQNSSLSPGETLSAIRMALHNDYTDHRSPS